jgi:hypothetical protein
VEIQRVSLIPFDVRANPNDETLGALEVEGFTRLVESPWSDKIVGSAFHYLQGDDDSRLIISRHGLGMKIQRHSYSLSSLGSFGDVSTILVSRNRHHREILSGDHQDAKTIKRLTDRFVAPLHKRSVRPEVWTRVPYVFSFFYVPYAAASMIKGEDDQRGLFALLEPSQVRPSRTLDYQDEVQECAHLVQTLNTNRFSDVYPDVDVKVGSFVLCSWAGLVAFDEHQCDLEYFEALEIRLQSTWMHASFIRQWAELALGEDSMDPVKLSSMSSELKPIMRQAKRVIDGTASSRDQKIFDELVRSSDLLREIDGAESAIADVRHQIDIAQEIMRRRSNLAVESLLLILASLQIVPLVMEVPVVQIQDWWITSFVIALLGYVVLRFRKLR